MVLAITLYAEAIAHESNTSVQNPLASEIFII